MVSLRPSVLRWSNVRLARHARGGARVPHPSILKSGIPQLFPAWDFSLIPLPTFFFLRPAFCPRPSLFHALSRPPERQRVRRHIFGDATGGGDIGAASNFYRSDQRGVAANEHAIFDHGLLLVHAIVIAGDGARADVDAFADFRVAQIAEVICLRPLTELDFLGLDEVAHVSAFAYLASGAQMRIRSQHRSCANARVFHNGPRPHRDPLAND